VVISSTLANRVVALTLERAQRGNALAPEMVEERCGSN